MPDGVTKRAEAELGQPADAGPANHVDVLIIGAGLSGIGAACRLEMNRTRRSYAILEGRGAIGGTWDLFRFPGIRSDSDMHTLGYRFRPWREKRPLADGATIRQYVHDTAAAYGVERHIRFNHRATRASWSSATSRWTVEAERTDTGDAVRLTCSFLFMCGGYYDYAAGHAPAFPGADRFRGTLVHPQFWPPGLDHAGKRVVVIGSGATAVTLVPALAATAAHVTMLQRSPSYIFSLPSHDPLGEALRRVLPERVALRLIRARNILISIHLYRMTRKNPEAAKQRLIGLVRDQLAPGYDVGRHFTPRYNPWDQRVCLVPDGDLFEAIRSGRASVETDTIDSFTETGIRLASGTEIAADIAVSATGLKMHVLGGMALEVDGAAVEPGRTMAYKGMMLSGVPNFAFIVGYANASWTLKADLVAGHVCRLLNFMRRRGYASVTPERDPAVPETPFLDFSSGYIQRAVGLMPKQGDRAPWKLNQNYIRDLALFRLAPLADRALRFTRAAARAR